MTKNPLNSLRVPAGSRVKLLDRNASQTYNLTREMVATALPDLRSELADLQELLYAAGTHSVLVILQGMDTSGKDGTIGNVMEPVNPIGVTVTPFKVPSKKELSHDFLWRVHRETPALGMLGIFNRSHYEDVLVVRVHGIAPPAVWRKRYRHIVEFERVLTDSNTILLKFFLHISKAEQEERLLAREADVNKAWKLAVGDWKEREHWRDYIRAYEDALSETSTEHAPWHVIPADRKWLRDHIVTRTLVETLRPYKKQWLAKLEQTGEVAKAELAAFRETKRASVIRAPSS